MVALMLQGTGSDVGKSLLVAGLCRALANRGLRVRPFKPQNMACNSTLAKGGEIGSAQALQALACRVEPDSDMNPVLLQPTADNRSRLLVQGQPAGWMGGDFRERRQALLPQVLQSFARLQAAADIVVVEGAGSPAEINLRAGDIANMGFARAAKVPVVLVGDINRGGVIAAIVGTRAVLAPADAAMIRGFLINKFRGDMALFADGNAAIARLSGWPALGIVPWLTAASRLPAEDSLAATPTTPGGALRIACPMLPHIANFDTLDPLRLEPGVELAMVPPGRPLPQGSALLLLPDSSNPLADARAMQREGWSIDLRAHHRAGGRTLGLGAGALLLGGHIRSPDGESSGLGLLALDSVLHSTPRRRVVAGTAFGVPFKATEVDAAHLTGADCARPFARLADGRCVGATSADGRVWAAPLLGWLAATGPRNALLAKLGAGASGQDHAAQVDAALQAIAAAMEQHLNIDRLLEIAA